MASLEEIEKSVFSVDGGTMRDVMLELSQAYVRKGQFISALAWNMALLSFYEVCVHEAKKQGGPMWSYIFDTMQEKGHECEHLASNCPYFWAAYTLMGEWR